MELIFNNTGRGLKKAVTRYRNRSFTFLHHTGYMFGIGCKADDQEGLERIKELKQRSDNKGFILLFPEMSALSLSDGRINIKSSMNDFRGVCLKTNNRALTLLEQYQGENLTLCLPVKEGKEFEQLKVNNKLAVRVPGSKPLRSLIKLLGRPVVSTSINRQGEKPLEDLQEIEKLDWFDFALLPAEMKKKSNSSDNFVEVNRPSTIIEPLENELLCHREGSVSFKEVEESYNSPLVLFVCTGNICRSPLAEYYARHFFKMRGLEYRTESAGFISDSVAISANSFSVLSNDKIPVDEHYSQHLRGDLIRRSWLILTMEDDHRKMILKSFPWTREKVYTLSSFCGSRGDVADPFQQSLDRYVDTYQLIKRYISVLADKLQLRREKLITLPQLAKLKPEKLINRKP
jgi:protein-tyrosine-phosphatase/tRNA A37 threonylcarbamoyladenosine synthetase subunit TsaC/SUA5/YrdC